MAADGSYSHLKADALTTRRRAQKTKIKSATTDKAASASKTRKKRIETHPIEIAIQRGDCLELIKQQPAEKFDLAISSPPYFIGKAYDTSKSTAEFLDLHRKLFPEIIRTLKPGGSLCWQVGYHVLDGRVIPLDYLIQQVASEFPELMLRNRVIWTFRHGTNSQTRLSGRHEVVLWYTKGDKYKFNLDEIRIPQLYPGKTSYKGKHKGKPSGNPLGKNPSDVWDIPNVKAQHPEKTKHPCQFPTALVRRFVRALAPTNGWVLDPFAGSGSAGVAAAIEKRSFVGFERNARYVKIAKKRIEETLAGTPKVRPDVPVRLPQPNERVAKIPAHFRLNLTD